MENNVNFTIICGDKKDTVFAPDGKRLFDFLTENGYYTASFCGGNGLCGKCLVTVDGKEELSCRTDIKDGMTVLLPFKAQGVSSKSGIYETHEAPKKPFFALDIGTTTLALALADSDSGAVSEVFVCDNPQTAYGADVISRIGVCRNGGLEKLHSCLIKSVNSLLNKACEKYGIFCVDNLIVSANTTMLHLFLNVDCSLMGEAPYTPSFLDGQSVSGESIGIMKVRKIETLPCFSSFVGADIAAGLLSLKKPKNEKWNFLFDLGTNAEIAMFSSDKVICTSAAAGPCFEGANITCGMSATPGAVSSFKLLDGKKQIETVGGEKAVGICGTGLIDIIAELLKCAEIDETGYLENEEPYEIADTVYLYQKDIREFQVAKSAVKSAAEILMKRAGVTEADVETVYLSGGFSSFINTANASACGLFPFISDEKCCAVMNTSLAGALKYGVNPAGLDKIMKNFQYIDLNADTDFSNSFIENINFD